MIKQIVDIDSWDWDKNSLTQQPRWAFNYLEDNEILRYLRLFKKTRRKATYLRLLGELGKEVLANDFECNAKGKVVFKWNSAGEKVWFILKWD